jgi:glycosyltransferase involved in cell wall biosynthesis
VVVSDAVGCAPDLVEEGVTGAVYPVGDVEALANALGRVLRQPPDQEALASRIRQYSVAAAADGIMMALGRLCGAAIRQ